LDVIALVAKKLPVGTTLAPVVGHALGVVRPVPDPHPVTQRRPGRSPFAYAHGVAMQLTTGELGILATLVEDKSAA
jgi:hypothetical protein